MMNFYAKPKVINIIIIMIKIAMQLLHWNYCSAMCSCVCNVVNTHWTTTSIRAPSPYRLSHFQWISTVFVVAWVTYIVWVALSCIDMLQWFGAIFVPPVTWSCGFSPLCRGLVAFLLCGVGWVKISRCGCWIMLLYNSVKSSYRIQIIITAVPVYSLTPNS